MPQLPVKGGRVFRKLSLLSLVALFYASSSFAQWVCNPSSCISPTQIWPSTTTTKVGVGTTNPYAIFHAHMNTNSNFQLFDSFGAIGSTGVLINSVDDTNGTLNPLAYNASKHVFLTGNVGIGIVSPGYALHVYGTGNAPRTILTQAASAGTNSYGDGQFVSDKTALSVRSYSSTFNAFSHVSGLSLANMSEVWADQIVAESNAGLLIGTGSRSTTPLPPIIFATQSTERMRITGDGVLGVGTSTPDTRFRADVSGMVKIFGSVASVYFADFTTGGVNFGKIQGANPGASAAAPIIMQPDGGNVVIGQSGSKLGINNTSPSATLDVTGTIHASGDITSSGSIYANYQDVAEWVPASGSLEPGTVVVLDPEQHNQVTASAASYDTAVAGVVSERPGIVLGQAAANKAQIATTGRVKVKVDARNAPINVGDLLVTSDIAGTAMKSEPLVINGRRFHQPGTILGKALEPLASGTGEILVLLSLQ